MIYLFVDIPKNLTKPLIFCMDIRSFIAITLTNVDNRLVEDKKDVEPLVTSRKYFIDCFFILCQKICPQRLECRLTNAQNFL